MIAKNRFFLFFVTAIILSGMMFTQYGCRHDPEVFTDVCFESEILPIFQNNCAVSGCHNQETAKEDLVLDSYDNIIAGGITAGNAKKSLIYKAITRGVEIMPPGRKLSGQQIALIYSWIQGGALNSTGCSIVDCDTVNVTYNAVISPIIAANCLSCHGADTVFNFSNYASLSLYLDTNSQKLINNISYTSGYQSMPPSGQLNACVVKKIKVWITAGYLNN
jgi:mono/diheme cytochrome c family protein